MMNSLIKPSKALGYSSIFLDFLAGSETTKPFYPAGSLEDVASRLDNIEYKREKIVEILEKQNQLYGASDKTFDNIRKLKDRQCLCLFTGQQAGLFGGPLLVIIKALSIVKAARLYSKKLNRPVIPVFWIAGDDHDFEEVNHTYLLSKTSKPVSICYKSQPEIELPISEIKFSDESELVKAKELFKQTLGETDFTGDLYRLIENTHTVNDTFVTAFGKLMAALTSDTGLIFFSPGDIQAKQLSVELFKAIIDKQGELQKHLMETNLKIKKEGYHIQVEKKDNATHLFYNFNGRKPVLRDGDYFTVGEQRFSEEELIQCVENHPERFSPDVMTRPVLQSYFFPVVSQKGGAAEIAYLAQINQIFELFNLVTPFYKARPSVTILEKRFEKLINEHDIEFEEIVGDIEQVINRVLAKTFPEDIEKKFNSLRKHIECHFEDFSSDTLKFDSALENFARLTLGKIDFTLKAFEGKVFSSHKKKSKEARERLYRMWHSLYPNRNFQERSINVCYFLSRYGMAFMNFLYDKIDCEEKAHQIIHLSEYKS